MDARTNPSEAHHRRPNSSPRPDQKLSDDDVRFIRGAPYTYGSGDALAQFFGVSKGLISRIRSRQLRGGVT